MSDQDLVAEHWPHLAALTRTLDALDKATVTTSGGGMSDDEIVEAIRRYEKRNTSNWRQ